MTDWKQGIPEYALESPDAMAVPICEEYWAQSVETVLLRVFGSDLLSWMRDTVRCSDRLISGHSVEAVRDRIVQLTRLLIGSCKTVVELERDRKAVRAKLENPFGDDTQHRSTQARLANIEATLAQVDDDLERLEVDGKRSLGKIDDELARIRREHERIWARIQEMEP